jgi:hypothetical protein
MYGSAPYAAAPYAAKRESVLVDLVRIGARTFSLLGGIVVQPIKVNQNDYGYELGPWTLLDGSGNSQDLTGANLILNVQDSQDPSGSLLFSGEVSVDDTTDGLVHYTVASGNFPNTGVFLGQMVASFGSEQVSWPPFQITVLPALPKSNN